MFYIAVCDDDIRFTRELESVLFAMEEEYRLSFEIEAYHDGGSLVSAIQSGQRYDIICLDIQMEGINGLETARRIRSMDRTVELIYVTSYDSYMKDTFDASPSGFIVKPLERDKFDRTFRRVLVTVMGQDEYYRFRYNKEDYKLPIRSILYFCSDLRKVHIISTEGSYMECRKLGEISASLSQGNCKFLRIHKSYLVNYCHVIRFAYDEVEMSDGKILTISARQRQEVDAELMKLRALTPRQGWLP